MQSGKRRERLRRWRAANPGKDREYKLRAAYGITQDDYDTLLAEQGGGCAICGLEPGETPFPVDHDHETGDVRGILCVPCNTQVTGLDRPGWLERAQAYIRRR